MERSARLVETLRGKIVIAFALILIAVGVMWAVNKVAFEKITSIVTELSTPNEKLTISRRLSVAVSNLPHLQQTEVMQEKNKPSISYINQTSEIGNSLNALRAFLIADHGQLARVDSITSLLATDNNLFKDYLKLRYEIEQKRVFERQLNVLSKRMDSQKVNIDSNVVTNEKKVTTTTIIPSDTVQIAGKKESWIKRIFSKPRQETVVIQKEPKVIVEEQVNTTIDTLTVAKSDTGFKELGRSLRKIERKRAKKLNKLEESEQELLKANNELIHRIQNILNEVEKQEVNQVKDKTGSTVLLASKTISLTRSITIGLVIVALIFAILIIIDVTRSRRYRQQLEAAKAEAEYHSMAKQRFLANMSHEIRTPLQSIIGYSEQQLNEERLNNSNIQAIHDSSTHLLQIVNQVLDYSRITSGKFSFVNNPFSVNKLIAEVFSGIKPLASKKGVLLELDMVNLAVESVTGDAFRLKQVLFNLLGNAIKFTEKGKVKLTVSSAGKEEKLALSFVVADTGIGMSESDLSLIFNQFEQVGSSQEHKSGTGLGLSIVKELVEAQQGTITVQSEPGKGTTFTVEIPFLFADENQFNNTSVASINKVLFDGKVWLVDDDELILRLTSIILTKYNIQHTCFNTAEQVLAAQWTANVKLIFSDIRLPGINGAELCRMLRKKIPPSVRIVALTAQVLPEEKEGLFKSGFNELLLKPFTEAELIAVLQKNVTSKVTSPAFDLSKLEQMVGDKEQVYQILRQCDEDTRADIQELKTALLKNDADKTSLVMHRLAGRIGQVGEKNLAAKLRKAEISIRRDNNVAAVTNQVEGLVSEIHAFLQVLEDDYLEVAV